MVRARLRVPFAAGWGTVDTRELLLLRLEDSSGNTGFGEAAPLEPYDGISIDDVRGALEDCRPALTAADPPDHAQLLVECASLAVVTHALSAIDMALWDLLGRRLGRPVWSLLEGEQPQPVEVNYTIAVADRTGAAGEAAQARAGGFGCVKVKVGLGDDAGRVAAVRAAAGPRVAIRLDANGAWSPQEAEAMLSALAPAGIELCEEPAHGLGAIEQVSAATSVPIAIDESTSLAGALDRRLCDAACLKIGTCGGISATIDAARRARKVGYEVYLASALDGPLGIAAALHAASVIGAERPCGLATLPMFEGRSDPLPAVAGRIAVPERPGLGAGLEAWYS